MTRFKLFASKIAVLLEMIYSKPRLTRIRFDRRFYPA